MEQDKQQVKTLRSLLQAFCNRRLLNIVLHSSCCSFQALAKWTAQLRKTTTIHAVPPIRPILWSFPSIISSMKSPLGLVQCKVSLTLTAFSHLTRVFSLSKIRLLWRITQLWCKLKVKFRHPQQKLWHLLTKSVALSALKSVPNLRTNSNIPSNLVLTSWPTNNIVNSKWNLRKLQWRVRLKKKNWKRTWVISVKSNFSMKMSKSMKFPILHLGMRKRKRDLCNRTKDTRNWTSNKIL